MLSIGACVAFEPSKQFSCYLKPISEDFIPAAMEVTGLSLEKLHVDGLILLMQWFNLKNGLIRS